MRPALGREKDLREKLGKIRGRDGALDAYLETVKEIKLEILQCDAQLVEAATTSSGFPHRFRPSSSYPTKRSK